VENDDEGGEKGRMENDDEGALVRDARRGSLE